MASKGLDKRQTTTTTTTWIGDMTRCLWKKTKKELPFLRILKAIKEKIWQLKDKLVSVEPVAITPSALPHPHSKHVTQARIWWWRNVRVRTKHHFGHVTGGGGGLRARILSYVTNRLCHSVSCNIKSLPTTVISCHHGSDYYGEPIKHKTLKSDKSQQEARK